MQEECVYALEEKNTYFYQNNKQIRVSLIWGCGKTTVIQGGNISDWPSTADIIYICSTGEGKLSS